MKILFDAQIFRQQRYGGISRYFCELASRLDRIPDMQARIVAPHHGNGYLAQSAQGLLLGWDAARMKRLGKFSRFAARILERSAIPAMRPDIVHETYFWGPSLRGRGTARVLTVYDMIHERLPQHFPSTDPTAAAKRRAVERADHVICISESTRRDLVDILGVPPAKVSVTFLSAGMRSPATNQTVSDRPYLLYVGDRGGYKNFAAVAKAVAGSVCLADVSIVCFGGGAISGAEWRLLNELRIDRSRIVWCGGDDRQLAALYAGALCFVYPSLYEGFGIPPLEAMQCRCPVACSNTSSIPEVVGEAGIYFDPHDVESIRHALETIMASESVRDLLRERGQQQVLKFSWDRCAAETAQIYRSLVGAASRQLPSNGNGEGA